MLFYDLINNLCVPFIMGQTSKIFTMPIELLRILNKINFQCIHWRNRWDIVVGLHITTCDPINPLFIFLAL